MSGLLQSKDAITTTCPQCGRVYLVIETQRQPGDSDHFRCLCGYLLAEWTDAELQVFQLVAEPG
jgi:hypothetical protein